jgi:hypothetical protein
VFGGGVILLIVIALAVGFSSKVGQRLLATISHESALQIKNVAKTTFITLQILVLFPVVLDLEYPEPFGELLASLSLVTIDLNSLTTGLECFFNESSSYYFYVLIATLFPTFVCILLVLARKPYWVVFVTFLMLPASSVAAFRVYACETFDDDSTWLRADYNVECDTELHNFFKLYAGFVILLWPVGVPLMTGALLYKHRELLAEPHEERAKEAEVVSYKLLFEGYQSAFFFWELVVSLRRLFLIGVLVVLAQGSVIQLAIGIFVCLTTITLQAHYFPFEGDFANLFALAAEWLVFLALFLGLIGRMDPSKFEGDEGSVIGTVLAVFTGALLALSVLFVNIEAVRSAVTHLNDHRKNFVIEWAVGFNDVKFITTLAAVTTNHVSKSNVLVYHYCSMETALNIRAAGGIPVLLREEEGENIASTKAQAETEEPEVPAMKRKLSRKVSMKALKGKKQASVRAGGEGEIKFSLCRPHAATHLKESFASDEVCLVCSLPRWLLRPSRENGEDLWTLNGEHVRALGGAFQHIGEAPPFPHDALLLPSQCIERAFQLKNDELLSDPLVSSNSLVFKEFSNNDGVRVTPLDSCAEYADTMASLRAQCETKKANSHVLMYHYTNILVADLILAGGFRMSTQGQGDGGVYLSTRSPASYGLGTSTLEENMIVDCFGKERLEEYRGKHKLDVCFVVEFRADLLSQAPGGRSHARVVSKATFHALATPAANTRDFYLNPQCIRAAFLIDPVDPLLDFDEALMAREAAADEQSFGTLAATASNSNGISKTLLDIAQRRSEETYTVDEQAHVAGSAKRMSMLTQARPNHGTTNISEKGKEESSDTLGTTI